MAKQQNNSTASGKKRFEFRVSSFEFPSKARRGFTIAELLISTMILGILIVAGGSIYANFYNSIRNIKAANLIYDEARFSMERIVKEIRTGTIDYEEYYNQATNFTGSEASKNETFGQNYCQYSQQFYKAGPDGQFGTYDDESTGIRKAGAADPLSTAIQDKLYLINVNGTKRTYIKRIEDADGIGAVAMLKMEGFDYGMDHIDSDTGGPLCDRDTGERDGLIDTWLCETGFNCQVQSTTVGDCTGDIHTVFDDPANFDSSFVTITPSSLDVLDLKFFVTPADDPFKSYADPATQIQPHVTIRLVIQANTDFTSDFRGGTPNITLESTVSARAYTEIITECNLQECIDGDTRECPKTGEVAENTQVTCAQGVWPACSDTDYEIQALANIIALYASGDTCAISAGASDGLDHTSPFDVEGGRTFYESGNEIESCATDACKQRRCSDGFDNDGNGLLDGADPVCLFDLCNNGYLDPGEDCIDVGGVCYFRQKTSPETGTLCFDGYDNDCDYDPLTGDGGADQFDQGCIDYICGNGIEDPVNPVTFLRSDYIPKNYLLGADPADVDVNENEQCIDIGGICDNATSGTQDLKTNENDSALCSDGLDNDCDGNADEFDTECKTVICSNGIKDCDLAPLLTPSPYPTPEYTKGYIDALCIFTSDNDEKCPDVGGVCGAVPGSETVCTGGMDEDCDGDIDNDDSDCCPDVDGDNYSPSNGGLCTLSPLDCNDNESNAYPGNTEICDGIDNNCDGQTDEGVKNTYYQDSDGDNHGNPSITIQACAQPSGYVTDNTDCDDTEPLSYPGNTEVCDGVDNDCDTLVDEGLLTTYYLDSDTDTYGNNSVTTQACAQPSGYVTDNTDCDDTNINIFPGATEVCDLVADDDCDGLADDLDSNCCIDEDLDGYGKQSAYLYTTVCTNNTGLLDGDYDCDDTDGSINPGATEICDGKDNDCDGNIDEEGLTTYYQDYDGDTFGNPLVTTQACSPSGYVADNTDCDDTKSGVNPDEFEVCDDALLDDEDCDTYNGLAPGEGGCLTTTNRQFWDFLGNMDYISTLDAGITQNAYLEVTGGSPTSPVGGYAVSDNLPLSEAGCSQVSDITYFDYIILGFSPNFDLDFQFSADGGATWCGDDNCTGDVISYEEFASSEVSLPITFPSPGTSLKWRAYFVTHEINPPKRLSRLKIGFKCVGD